MFPDALDIIIVLVGISLVYIIYVARTRGVSKTVFAAALIAVALISGLSVYIVMKEIEPRPHWEVVLSSGWISSNVTTWTSDTFEVERRIGISWASSWPLSQNATCNVTVYTAYDDAAYDVVSTYFDVKPHQVVTEIYREIYRDRGTYKITVFVSGVTPSTVNFETGWWVDIWDQRYPL